MLPSKTFDSSTGEILKSDTSKVIIPISLLREANAKLIERNYLIKINSEKDSINSLNKIYIIEQSNIIKDFQSKVVNLNNINNKLNSDIDKQKSINKLFKGSTAALIVVVLGFLIIR